MRLLLLDCAGEENAGDCTEMGSKLRLRISTAQCGAGISIPREDSGSQLGQGKESLNAARASAVANALAVLPVA